jgi:hypothetical protein
MHHKHIGGIAFLIVAVLFGGPALVAYRISGFSGPAVYYSVVGGVLTAIICGAVWVAGRLTHHASVTEAQPIPEANAPTLSQRVDSERL